MTGFLGEVDADLGDFVLEHLRDKKRPDDLVDGLEPVRPTTCGASVLTVSSGTCRRSFDLRHPALASTRLRKQRICCWTRNGHDDGISYSRWRYVQNAMHDIS